jgi:hypothetical protein
MMKKLKDIWEDIKFRIKEIPHKYKDIKNGIRNIFRWVPIIYKDRDFANDYLLRLEYEKLKMMYNYFKDADIVVDEWHIALTIKRAIGLLEIIMEEDEAYNKYLDDNYGNVNLIEDLEETDDPNIYRYNPQPRVLSVPVKVNIRNAYRFAHPTERFHKNRNESTLEKNLRENYGMFAMELRKLKAMHIYYEMRKNYTYEWWD